MMSFSILFMSESLNYVKLFVDRFVKFQSSLLVKEDVIRGRFFFEFKLSFKIEVYCLFSYNLLVEDVLCGSVSELLLGQ